MTDNLSSALQGLDPDMMMKMMRMFKSQDPLKSFRTIVQVAQIPQIENFLEDLDFLKYSSDLLLIAVSEGRSEVVDFLIDKGADFHSPPELLSDDDQYRRSPFILQAVRSGSLDTVKVLMNHGCSILDSGAIGLSKKRKNVVISNVIGCAAFYGRKSVLEFLVKRLDSKYLDLEALEQFDKVTSEQSKFKKELSKHTPLMLAVGKDD
mmetsp:Transcript_9715/g.16354  ORF Transcript_9715/g.16354 Transcript_9715/m.16354 type:complete len:207 (+) Transcript_9715:8-628(+)